jgi:hypothetical protein
MYARALLLLILVILIPGCEHLNLNSTPPVDIDNAITTQKDATDAIDKHAKNVIDKSKGISKDLQDVNKAVNADDKQEAVKKTSDIASKNSEINQAATSIIVENDTLKGQIGILKQVEKERDSLIKDNLAWEKKYESLEEKYNSTFRTITYWLYAVGAILIAGGMFMAFYMRKYEFLWLAVGGVILLVVAIGAVWIEKYIGWILGAIVVIVTYAILRSNYLAKRGILAATVAAEATKRDLHQIDPEAVERLYGPKEGGPGTITQDEHQQALIRAARKHIEKRWKPTTSTRMGSSGNGA